ASAAATPIASAKRPKRRANQAISVASPGRRTALAGDDGGATTNAKGNAKPKSARDNEADGAEEATVVSEGVKSSSTGGGSSNTGTSSTTTSRSREEEGQGADTPEQAPEAPSPTKARKGSISATPRTSGSCTDSRRQQQQPQGERKGRSSSVGGGAEGGGKGAKGDQDQNRHKPKESSIFSPALNQTQEEARDQAPASTVGADRGAAAPAAEEHGNPPGDDAGANHVQTALSASTAEPLAKKGRTTPSQGGEGGEAAAAVPGEEDRSDATENAERGAGDDAGDDEEETPSLAIREAGDDGDGDGLVEEEEEEEDDEEEFNPYCFIAHLPPYNTVKHHTPEAPALPEKRKTRHGKELTLVLDLDETLVHCTVDPIVNPDHRFEVHFNGEEFQVYVRKRPHLDAFLEAVSELFEVVVFTASQQVYAERLLNMIDPQKKLVKYRLYRDACMALEGNYLKDLNVLGRDLSKVAIVDNSPYAYGFQIDNGIPIESWFDDRNDEELLHLLPLLKQLISESEVAGGDVRPFIRNIFKTHELVDKARNGDRGVGSPLHYPALAPAINNQEAEVAAAAEAGSA
ncbi:unnamed protein product, partial [Hapterophycus canaliculatus]